jgi:hypothetical protein
VRATAATLVPARATRPRRWPGRCRNCRAIVEPGSNASYRSGSDSRPATPDEYTARSAGYSTGAFTGRSPWDVDEHAFRSESLVGRAHDAIASIDRIQDDNKAELIESFDDLEHDGNPAARMAVALSDPAYVRAGTSGARNSRRLGAVMDFPCPTRALRSFSTGRGSIAR